uniref:coiled-coil domain-containing protein 14 n=1 Tax=Semicossyphus pulcher TaxID=241346 RepID=UPI0037E7F742
MKGTAKSKVVTSGRLTGRVKVQPAKRRVPPNPGPASCPEPAYSLYSTDSEDQVTSLHKGLDRCAALLGGILQAERAEALPSVPRALKGAAAKSRPSTSLGKKTIKKPAPQTDQRRCPPVQHGAGSKTPRKTHQSPAAAHSGVKLHPPQRPPHTHSPSLQRLFTSTPPPKTPTIPPSDQLPPPQTGCSSTNCEDDLVPVRDTDTHPANAHTCTLKMSDMQLDPAQADEAPQQDSASNGDKVRTAQDVLGELRALIAGQGSVAERLLTHLEQTVSSSSLMKAGGPNIQPEPELLSLQSQNAQLSRRVRTLQQQLKQREEAERHQNTETLCASEVMILQDELTAAQSQLQELQCDLAELRKALQDTQSQLRESEAKNALIQTDLDATRSRLQVSEREKAELSSLAQKRLEEIQNLNRVLQSRDSSHCPAAVDQNQLRKDPAAPPTDRVTQYLMSLGHLEHTHTEQVCVAAEREGDTSSHPDVSAADASLRSCVGRLEKHRRQLFNSALSQCDRVSLGSDWSARSGSTFDTRDEAAFRDGLAALDASIASLQKTIQLDLRR